MTSNRPQFSSPLTNDFLGNNKKKKPKKRDPNHERNEAKRAKLQADDDEEERLTSLIFGGDSGSAWHDDDDDDDDSDQNGEYGQDNDVDSVEDNNGALFEIDRTGTGDVGVDSEEEASQRSSGHGDENGSESSEDSEAKQKSAWIDEDDENITISLNKSNRTKKLRSSLAEDEVAGSSYEQKLRDRYEATTSATSRTDWATLPQNDNDDGESGSDSDVEGATASKLLSSTASLLTSSRLQPNMLSVKRCPDANIGNYNKSTVQAVQFHPQSDEDEPLMLTAGMDKMLRFFKVNETEGSEKIHSIHFPHLPIHSAAFLGDTGNVVVSGRRPFFYIYDTAAGKLDKIPRIQGRKEKSLEKFATSPDGSLIAFIGNDGYIILVEVKSKMWVADLKMNGSVRAVSFSPDGDFVIASGSDGEVYRFDIRTKKCVDRFRNEDGTISSYISATSRFLAVGAESGVVNFYKDSYRPFEKRSPVKSILNMHTSIDYMKFNPQGDILAMASRREKDSLKLVHVPTQTVFSNWPTSKTPLSYVWSLDFSPGSRFMAVGNDKGKCLLYKLNHYDDN